MEFTLGRTGQALVPLLGGLGCWGTRVPSPSPKGANSWRPPAHCCPHLWTAQGCGKRGLVGETQAGHFHSTMMVNSAAGIFHRTATKEAISHCLRQTTSSRTGSFLSKPSFSP